MQPVTAEPPITLSYATSTVTRGCVSSSSVGAGHEVHILSVEWSKVSKRGPGASPWNCHPGTVPAEQGIPAVKLKCSERTQINLFHGAFAELPVPAQPLMSVAPMGT